ncbi:hypothetical protein [Actinomadura luteofluorescens]|uniref:hypothetical protein n=1 Tax=Actinomadura luteofluorescens TaxID=46163 RepID=UPI0030CED539
MAGGSVAGEGGQLLVDRAPVRLGVQMNGRTTIWPPRQTYHQVRHWPGPSCEAFFT